MIAMTASRRARPLMRNGLRANGGIAHNIAASACPLGRHPLGADQRFAKSVMPLACAERSRVPDPVWPSVGASVGASAGQSAWPSGKAHRGACSQPPRLGKPACRTAVHRNQPRTGFPLIVLLSTNTRQKNAKDGNNRNWRLDSNRAKLNPAAGSSDEWGPPQGVDLEP